MIFDNIFIIYNLTLPFIMRRKKQRALYLLIVLTLISIGIGTLIELIEFIGVLYFNAGKGVGGYFNNTIDLFVNMIGSFVGSLIVFRYHKRKIFKDLIER